MSAWRWTIFQSPRSKRKIIVTRSTCSCSCRVTCVQHVGALDGDRVRDAALDVLDEVLEIDLRTTRAERVGGEQVALVDFRHPCFPEAAEAAEDRCRIVLGGDRQPGLGISVDEGGVGGLVALEEAVEVAAGAVGHGGRYGGRLRRRTGEHGRGAHDARQEDERGDCRETSLHHGPLH